MPPGACRPEPRRLPPGAGSPEPGEPVRGTESLHFNNGSDMFGPVTAGLIQGWEKMSGSTSAATPAGGMADDYGTNGHDTAGHGTVRRRGFLKLGGATLLAGGAAASTAAASPTRLARTPAGELARTAAGKTVPTAAPVVLDSAVPPDAQSLVPIPPGRIPAAVAKLDSIIEGVLAETGVPGLAAAVVHDGNVLYAKGFGVRDVNTLAPVDAATVFRLASVSKPLSSTVVAGAVGKGAMKWTDPVVAQLPSFALADSYVTAHVTYADLFSHTSGLPDHAGDLLEDLGYDQAYILNRLRLEPLEPFRAEYAYTNFGLTAAAEAAAAAAGVSWADLADEVLFSPLGMTSSSFRYADFLSEADQAAMHVRVGTKWVQKYARDADPEAPAGGASSNVLDLASWLILQLAGGAWNGAPVIGNTALSQTHLPHVRSGMPLSPISRSGFYGYGMNVSYDYAAAALQSFRRLQPGRRDGVLPAPVGQPGHRRADQRHAHRRARIDQQLFPRLRGGRIGPGRLARPVRPGLRRPVRQPQRAGRSEAARASGPGQAGFLLHRDV